MSPVAPLPRTLDLRKAASKGRYYAGELTLEAMPQVAAAVLSQSAAIRVEAACLIDEQRRAVVDLSIDGVLQLQCQRCLDALPFKVLSKHRLAVVSDDEAARQLPKLLEPLVAEEGDSDLWAIVEEEVLLALPSVARHDEDCLPLLREFTSSEVAGAPVAPKKNPFTVLAALKNAATKPSQE